MRKIFLRYISICLITAMLLSLTACGKAPTIMQDGADRFALGKEDENYALRNSGALLDQLIDDFSGSYYMPTGTQMDDDDFDDTKAKADGDVTPETVDPDPQPVPGDDTTAGDDTSGDYTPPVTPEPDLVPTTSEVGSWEDFLRVFHNAYNNTAEYAQFRLVNGYTLDMNTALQECYTELQREDPIDVSGVELWSWGSQGDEYVVEIDYFYGIDELISMKEQTVTLLDTAVNSIDVAGMSDYEIVCAVNNYLCDTVYYPESEPYAPVTHTAYGAFANGVAVCEGYACAAKLMLNEYGILCDIQVGDCYEGGGHAWNLVQLDGQWYQMDITWNDGGGDRTAYLLVTDDYMKKSRYWDETKYPTCAATAYQR